MRKVPFEKLLELMIRGNLIFPMKKNFNWFNESLFVKPTYKKNYLPDDCVSMKLWLVNI